MAITISICYLLEKKEIVILSKYISAISVINENFLFINAKKSCASGDVSVLSPLNFKTSSLKYAIWNNKYLNIAN